jgi:hypothetical protein
MGKLMLTSTATEQWLGCNGNTAEPAKSRIDYNKIIEVFKSMGYPSFDEYRFPIYGFGYTIGIVMDPNTNKMTNGVIKGIARKSDEEYTVMTIDEFIKMYPYKVGDRAIPFKGTMFPASISKMTWDEKTSKLLYEFNNVAGQFYIEDILPESETQNVILYYICDELREIKNILINR